MIAIVMAIVVPAEVPAAVPAVVLACVAASGAAALVVPAAPPAPSPDREMWLARGRVRGPADGALASVSRGPVGGSTASRPARRVALGAAAVTVGWFVLPPRLLVLAVVGCLAVAGVAALLRLRGSAARAAVVADRVRETCEALADDLAAGASTERTLARAGADWPDLEPVLAAHRLGLDVPRAWRELADRPGAAGLRLVAAAWQVSGRTGQGLASALRRVATDLRAADASRRVVDSELASARATGRLVAGLPVLAWLMGSGSDQHPVAWLLDGPAGWLCLVLGGSLLLLGLAWIELLARGATT